jgi:CBS domain-containing protein
MARTPPRVRLLVRDVMTSPVITVSPDTPVKEIAQLLADAPHQRCPRGFRR